MSQLHNDFARLILGRVQEELDNIFQGTTMEHIIASAKAVEENDKIEYTYDITAFIGISPPLFYWQL